MQKLLTVVLFVTAVVSTIPAKANLLDYKSYAYVDGSSTAWWGDTPYSSLSLTGSVEWVVFGPGQFAAAFPSSSYHPPANELVYAYQIDNTGSSDASTLDEAIVAGRPADTIGSFPLTYGGSNVGISPTTSSFVLSSFEYAHWFFQGGIFAGQSSAGLAYASPNAPEYEFGSLTNSGLGADADPLPSPSTMQVPVPEPCTTVLLAMSTALIGVRCGWRRMFRTR